MPDQDLSDLLIGLDPFGRGTPRLARGTRLGPYEITGLVGVGGMGEVYHARDTRLGRTVAVKILPRTFVADPDRLRRFEQEARAAAALNHPGVLAVYDVGVHEGTPYLVTELLEGATLGERLKAERLPVVKAIDYAAQVAQALAVAHAHGVVHRDLKPDNLFVTSNGRVKILDFGLAKLTPPVETGQSMTGVTGEGTLPHTVLGTAGYMAPEQIRGQTVDHRADIFSFGCVLLEMLEGRRAFAGDSPADTISAILKEPPPELTSSVERRVPSALRHIVRRCLEKDPAARFQSTSDLAFALESLAPAEDDRSVEADRVHTPKMPARPAWRWVAPGLALLALALAAVAARSLWRETPASPVAEFLVPPPSGDQSFATMPLPGLLPTSPQVGLSPDGQRLAFVASDTSGLRKLWIRSLDTSLPRVIDRTDGVTSYPFWSPDSRFVVVAIDGTLRKVDAATGTVERLCMLPEGTPPVPFITGSWSDEGAVLFSIGGRSGIYKVPASGGHPEPISKLDAARGDHYHSWPQHVPGGGFLLFVRTNDPKTTGVYAGRDDSREIARVTANDSRAVYAEGFLLRAIEDRLVAQPFDPSRLRLHGEAATLVPSVFVGAGRTPAFWASETGALVYAIGSSRERQFRWFSRTGAPLETVGPPGLYGSFDLSTDGSRIVTEVMKRGTTSRSTLSTLDTTRGVLAALTLGDRSDTDPRFGPGGEVAFARNSTPDAGITRVDAAGANQSVLFPRGNRAVVWMEDWASDGSSVVYRSAADRDAWQLVSGTPEPRRLTRATREPIEQVQFSPDARWIAYNTSESGRQEIYVSPVPATGQHWQVSLAGGVQPVWRGDGRELYYLGLDAGLYAVEISAQGTRPQAGRPALLFRTPFPVISAVVEQYRVADDGNRFLLCLSVISGEREPLRMLLNWPAKLAQTGDRR
jgi:eukaryotic-like serine/threonine-protein kinase